MYKFNLLIILLTFSCSRPQTNSLLIPPKFNELPDPEKIDKNKSSDNDEDIKKLKNLLLQDEN